MWLPDTNVWIRYLNPQPSPVKAHFLKHSPDQIFLCDVVKAELFFGAFKSVRRDENLALIDDLAGGFVSFPFDGDAARYFGQIRTQLSKAGTPIGPYDLQIAAITLSHGFTLVTHNTKEFSRVAGLHLDDWEI
ncbi:MAG: type II toxin-antitoxin system VapC family toxin [Methylovulum miyakonense]|uniref:type II toxin-antitoxin system VapC family toxin n=1 Tax=Methylovulum miyakonense TaxID=645578 RepID=UPI003BB4C92C